MKRGTLVVVALQEDFGKPRPAVVVQSDLFGAELSTLTICPLTTTIVDAPLFRLDAEPSARNGLMQHSQIMVDKISSVRRDRIGPSIGELEPETLTRLDRSLALWLGLGD